MEQSTHKVRHIRVVGALVRREGRLLLTRRLPDRDRPLLWEFPGGKVGPDETDVQALARELEEELGVHATIGGLYHELEHAYPDLHIDLAIYECRLDGDPRCIEVSEIAWVAPEELELYPLTPADVPVAERLMREAAAAPGARPF